MIDKSGSQGHPVVVMIDGVDAGTVPITGIYQHFMCPEIAFADRITGCTIACDPRAADILKQSFCFYNLIDKFGSGLTARPSMPIAVTGEFMPGVDQGSYQAG